MRSVCCWVLTLPTAHYKWEIGFAPGDVNLCAVHVVLDASGNLTLNVPRRGPAFEEHALPIFL